jgi:probable phosphoglycerate mutase
VATPDAVVVEADGGSRGNPGPASYGAVLRDAVTGDVLAEDARTIGVATNNVAEYSGLVAGLKLAVEYAPGARVEVRMDSKLVVEQMSGRWRVKHANLQPLAREAAELVRSLGSVSFTWVPRAENKHADRLANDAMDGKQQESAQDDPVELDRDQTGQSGASQSGAAEPAPAGPGSSDDQRRAAVSWTGAMGSPTRLFLLRHGQTELSVDRRYSGRGDVPLTDLGLQQARAAAKRLAATGPITEEGAGFPVLTSPLERAASTARAVAETTGGEVLARDGLVETDFGQWEGLTFGEASERYAQLHRSWLGDPEIAPPEGESLAVVFERVRAFQQDVLEQYAGRTALVVSHVTPIKSLLRLALDAGPSLFYRLHLDLASLSVVEFYPDGNASVRLVNDTSHLA